MPVFPKLLFHGTTPKTVFLSGGTPTFKDVYRHENKKVVGSTQRLLQYCQLPDKYSHILSGDTWKWLQYLKILIYLFHDLSWSPY
jgi:hypothetical protein